MDYCSARTNKILMLRTITYMNLNNQYVEWKLPGAKEYIVCDSTYVKFKNRQEVQLSELVTQPLCHTSSLE